MHGMERPSRGSQAHTCIARSGHVVAFPPPASFFSFCSPCALSVWLRFLSHDLQVHPTIGLRCNSIVVLNGTGPAGADQMVAAYEYCNNGARQLVQYTFATAARGLDVSAVNVEAKNNPSLEENTFTSLAVSQSQPNRCVAMTYGG